MLDCRLRHQVEQQCVSYSIRHQLAEVAGRMFTFPAAGAATRRSTVVVKSRTQAIAELGSDRDRPPKCMTLAVGREPHVIQLIAMCRVLVEHDGWI